MNNLFSLINALEYIDENITEKINVENIASHCYVSVSGLQKLFRYALHISVAEYVFRRRMTMAARDLLDERLTILDIAVKYQYNSHEAFTRAFFKLWGVPPSQFKAKWRFSELFPRIIINNNEFEGENIMPRRRFDISELYDEIKKKDGTFILCFDMVGLMGINNIYGHQAGDKAIVEALKRIDDAASDDMLVFRIGGDEFVLITGFNNTKDTQMIAEKTLSKNGEPIYHEDNEISVAMRVGGFKLNSRSLRYSELFPALQESIKVCQQSNLKINIVE